MSTTLYSTVDGELTTTSIDSIYVASHIESGWRTTKDTPKITKEEADTNDTGKLSTKEIRSAAKEAGIEDHATARIKTLEAALWPSSKQT